MGKKMSFTYSYTPPCLVAQFERPQRMLSWSITHPGFCENDRVAWLRVKDTDINPNIDAQIFLNTQMQKHKLRGAIGLMTSRNLDFYHFTETIYGFVKAQSLTTLGLNNACHVGFPENEMQLKNVGTINNLCAVNVPLSDGALIEASSIASQAKTAALMDYYRSHLPHVPNVTGTGTDCIVVSSPVAGSHTMFSGLHTHAGKAIGEAVYQSTIEACATWHKGEDR